MVEKETPKILKDYTFVKNIGEGNFGKVKLTILNSTNENYAIKILNKEKLKTQTRSSSYNEIEVISKLKHQNIVHVEKIIEDEKNYYIIMEYCEKGELFDYIVSKERLGQFEASNYFYQLINGVDYLHKMCFAHRDLKPENLLLTKNNLLKIIDFGLCHDFDGTKLLKTKCGSPSYASPEILKGNPYNAFKSDIWSCGIILYGMLCGFLPFDGDTNQEIFKQIIQCKPEFPSFLEEDSVNLLIGILNPNPEERLSIEKIKNHPFYLKGRDNFLIQHNQNAEITNYNENLINNDNILENGISDYNSVEKKNFEISPIKKEKQNLDEFNNFKTLKSKKSKNKHNIYENIFTNIVLDDEVCDNIILSNKKDKRNDQNDNGSEKYDKTQKRKINEIAGLINKTRNINQLLETEGNQEKLSFMLKTFKKKYKGNKLKINSNKLFFYNNIINKKHLIVNFSNSNSNSNPQNKDDKLSQNLNILNTRKIPEQKQSNKIIFKNSDKESNKLIKENTKNIYSKKHIKRELKINHEHLDFFQKYLINKRKNINHFETNNQSPIKTTGLNFNLILSRVKEGINRDHKSNSENKNNNTSNEKVKNKRQLSEKKFKIYSKDNILFSQKRKKSESAKKRIVLNNEQKKPRSPVSNNTNYQQSNNIFYSLFGTNSIFKRKMSEKNFNNKNSFGYNSFSTKKNNKKERKLNMDKKMNLKIINLNKRKNNEKILKKEIKKNNEVKSQNNNTDNIPEIMKIKNKNNLNSKIKTDPKCNKFLDKVINRINVNNNTKIINNINIITIINKNKNENNNVNMNNNYMNINFKQGDNMLPIRKLNFERNNNLNIYNYFKNTSKEEKYSINPFFFEEDKKYKLSMNPKALDKNINSKDKLKFVFPNITISNKKL